MRHRDDARLYAFLIRASDQPLLREIHLRVGRTTPPGIYALLCGLLPRLRRLRVAAPPAARDADDVPVPFPVPVCVHLTSVRLDVLVLFPDVDALWCAPHLAFLRLNVTAAAPTAAVPVHLPQLQTLHLRLRGAAAVDGLRWLLRGRLPLLQQLGLVVVGADVADWYETLGSVFGAPSIRRLRRCALVFDDCPGLSARCLFAQTLSCLRRATDVTYDLSRLPAPPTAAVMDALFGRCGRDCRSIGRLSVWLRPASQRDCVARIDNVVLDRLCTAYPYAPAPPPDDAGPS